jgi:hypothetical protein
MYRVIAGLVVIMVLMCCVSCHKNTLKPGEVQAVGTEKLPSWADNPEKASTKTDRAFIGVSRQRSMEQDARTDARRDAFKQAAEALGVYVKNRLEEVASQADMSDDIFSSGIVSDELTRIETEATTAGTVEEYYIQKFQKNVDGELRYFYTAYCRYMVPRDYAQDLLEGVLKKERDSTADAHRRELLDRAMKKLSEMDGGDF